MAPEPRPALEEDREIIFVNGRVRTLEESRPLASALAVRGAELVYVGSSLAEAAALLSPTARRVSALLSTAR